MHLHSSYSTADCEKTSWFGLVRKSLTGLSEQRQQLTELHLHRCLFFKTNKFIYHAIPEINCKGLLAHTLCTGVFEPTHTVNT